MSRSSPSVSSTRLVPRLALPLYERLSGNRFTNERRRLAAVQWLSAEQVEQRTLARLRHLLHHATVHVAHYRELYSRSGLWPDDFKQPSDLARLPLTTKAALRDGFPDRVLAENIPARRRWPVTTSGSSGEPFRLFADRASLSSLMGSFAFFTEEWAGVSPWSNRLRVGGYRPLTGNVVGLPALSAPVRRLLLGQRLERLPDAEVTLESFCAAIGRLASRPYWIWSPPSVIAALAHWLLEDGRGLPAYPVVVMTSGETLTDLEAARIGRAFRCAVVNHYNAFETPHLAQTCPDNSALLHVNSERALIRVVRADGSAAAPGELGRVTLTDLTNQVMPLINYDLGDQALAGGPCPCGRGLPTIARLEGRRGELLRTPSGKLLSPASLCSFMHFVPDLTGAVREFQAAQTAPDAMLLRVVPAATFGAELASRIESDLRELLGPDMRVEVRTVDSLPREPSGKRLLIRSELPPAGQLTTTT
jgi:phenylacetate-CoA ligase